MTTSIPPDILNISLFGSKSRDDDDANSDLDILVVVANGTGKTAPDAVFKFIQQKFGRAPSLSWYGLRKIKALFNAGDLFAWHLHLESKTLAGTRLTEIAGVPADYKTALSDIHDLRQIAVGVEHNIRTCPANAVFEMGILYVCARNIAMAASWRLAARPSFGRYSPYELGVLFPVDREVYETMLQSRMASQRGVAPPPIRADEVLAAQQQLLTWTNTIVSEVEKVEGRDEPITTL